MDMAPVSARDMEDRRERFNGFIYFAGPFDDEEEIRVNAMITEDGEIDDSFYWLCTGNEWSIETMYWINDRTDKYLHLLDKLNELTVAAWRKRKEG